MKRLFAALAAPHAAATSFGLLLLRLCFGGYMSLAHGWAKFQMLAGKTDVGLLERLQMSAAKFPDPLGIGKWSYYGALASELGCGLLVVLGLFTRAACLPLIFTMGVAILKVHTNDPWVMAPGNPGKEPAMIYLAAFAALLFAGPGKYSVDGALGCGACGKPAQ